MAIEPRPLTPTLAFCELHMMQSIQRLATGTNLKHVWSIPAMKVFASLTAKTWWTSLLVTLCNAFEFVQMK
jgi:hypothetical protein